MSRDTYPSIPSRGTATQSKYVKVLPAGAAAQQDGQRAEQAVAAGRKSEKLEIAVGRLRERTQAVEGAGERPH